MSKRFKATECCLYYFTEELKKAIGIERFEEGRHYHIIPQHSLVWFSVNIRPLFSCVFEEALAHRKKLKIQGRHILLLGEHGDWKFRVNLKKGEIKLLSFEPFKGDKV